MRTAVSAARRRLSRGLPRVVILHIPCAPFCARASIVARAHMPSLHTPSKLRYRACVSVNVAVAPHNYRPRRPLRGLCVSLGHACGTGAAGRAHDADHHAAAAGDAERAA
eukprot:3270822-Pleurochrysis_carterae.AAC.1